MSVLLLLALLLTPFWALTLVKALRAVRVKSGDWVTANDRLTISDPAPPVSVLVAARNEEATLGRCLESLRAQTYPRFEVIVVDDRSEDRTYEVAKEQADSDPRITVLRAEELPDGWFGKPHALHLAASRATGDWLLLTDADTFHRERSIENGIAFALARGADAVSLVGEMIHPTLVPNLVTPQLYALLAASVERKKRKRMDTHEIWGACGGYFLMTRAAFDRAGGMERVKGEIAEDAALARELHRANTKYAFGVGSPALWKTTSYRTLAEIHRGYARNESFRLSGAKAFGFTLLIWLLALTPIMTALGTLLVWDRLSLIERAFGLGQYAFVLVVQATVRRISRTRWWLAPLAPIGALLAWLLVMSWSFGRGPIVWKGRTYG
jgi:glycosyltransferase involved in cell wall biosynthesis